MVGDENKKILLETVVFRPLFARKRFDHPKPSTSGNVNDNNSASVDIISDGRNDATCTYSSSYIFQRLKEFFTNENVDFEKWITIKSMKMAFLSQTVLGVMERAILAKLNQRNTRSLLDRDVNNGLRKCLAKSIFGGVVMAANIGCIMTAVTQFTLWRGYFSLWTVPCATTIIPTVYSYALGVKPKQAIKGGLMLGMLSSLAIFTTSLFYDLSIDETYQYIKSYTEARLKEKRESELYIFMKEHNIRSEWFGKWMLNRSRINEDIDDELLE